MSVYEKAFGIRDALQSLRGEASLLQLEDFIAEIDKALAIVLKRVEFLQRSAATVDQQQNKKILAANSRTNVEQERWLHELEAKFEGSVAQSVSAFHALATEQQRIRNLNSPRIDIFEWVLTRPDVSAWINPQDSDSKTTKRIALLGLPGYGKTFTAAFLVEHLLKRGSSIVCSHFCHYDSSVSEKTPKDRVNAELTNISESILSQLLTSRPELDSMVRPSMKVWLSEPKVTPAFAAKAPLLHWLPDFIAESQQQMYIVLDGLGETLHRTTYDHVLSFIDYVTDLTDNVRVLITSRAPTFVRAPYNEQHLFTTVRLPKKLAIDRAVAEFLVQKRASHATDEWRKRAIAFISDNADGCSAWSDVIATRIGEQSQVPLSSPTASQLSLEGSGPAATKYWQDLTKRLVRGDTELCDRLSIFLDIIMATQHQLTFRQVCQAAALYLQSPSGFPNFEKKEQLPQFMRLLSSFVTFSDPAEPYTSQMYFVHKSLEGVLKERSLMDVWYGQYRSYYDGRCFTRAASLNRIMFFICMRYCTQESELRDLADTELPYAPLNLKTHLLALTTYVQELSQRQVLYGGDIRIKFDRFKEEFGAINRKAYDLAKLDHNEQHCPNDQAARSARIAEREKELRLAFEPTRLRFLDSRKIFTEILEHACPSFDKECDLFDRHTYEVRRKFDYAYELETLNIAFGDLARAIEKVCSEPYDLVLLRRYFSHGLSDIFDSKWDFYQKAQVRYAT